MIHPDTRLAWIDDTLGVGVVATRPIPKGTIVWVRDPLDQRIPRRHAEQLGPLFRRALEHYTFWEDDEDLILCWDNARFVNHSCEATCLGGTFEFEICVRDIAAGEQLTDDYATFGYASELPCRCGAPTCRGRVRRSDAVHMAPTWDRLLLDAIGRLRDVEQPLWSLVRDHAAVRQTLSDPGFLRRHVVP